MGLKRVGASWTVKLGSYFRAGVLAVAVSFTGDISIAQEFENGVAAYDRGDYQAALKEFLPLADQGDAAAQYNLGIMYGTGEGVLEDDKEAVRWYRLAADQGYADAQYSLGVMYANGEGVLKDDKEAMRWYRLAADQGFAAAQYNLGVMYAFGEGVLVDNISAHMWFNIGDENGDAGARRNRQVMEERMTPADISEAVNSARTCMSSDYKNCR